MMSKTSNYLQLLKDLENDAEGLARGMAAVQQNMVDKLTAEVALETTVFQLSVIVCEFASQMKTSTHVARVEFERLVAS